MKKSSTKHKPAKSGKAEKIMKTIGSVLVILKEAAMLFRILQDLLP
jgi:hypothetical protein